MPWSWEIGGGPTPGAGTMMMLEVEVAALVVGWEEGLRRKRWKKVAFLEVVLLRAICGWVPRVLYLLEVAGGMAL